MSSNDWVLMDPQPKSIGDLAMGDYGVKVGNVVLPVDWSCGEACVAIRCDALHKVTGMAYLADLIDLGCQVYVKKEPLKWEGEGRFDKVSTFGYSLIRDLPWDVQFRIGARVRVTIEELPTTEETSDEAEPEEKQSGGDGRVCTRCGGHGFLLRKGWCPDCNGTGRVSAS